MSELQETVHKFLRKIYYDDWPPNVSGADDLIALLPATVKPDREAIIRMFDEAGLWSGMTPDEVADAILAAWPGRTEAEVLREAAFSGYFGTSAQSTLLRMAEAREGGRTDG